MKNNNDVIAQSMEGNKMKSEFGIESILEESKRLGKTYSEFLSKELASELYSIIYNSNDCLIEKIEEAEYLIDFYSSEKSNEFFRYYKTSEKENEEIRSKIILNLNYLLKNLYRL